MTVALGGAPGLTAMVFSALGDPHRVHLVEEIARRGSASATTLAHPLDVSRQAVVKHLQVLEKAGLISSRRQGRDVLWAVRREQLDRSATWLSEIGDAWDRRLDAIKIAAEG